MKDIKWYFESDWKSWLKNRMKSLNEEYIFGVNQWRDTNSVIREFSKLEKLGAEIHIEICKDTVYYTCYPSTVRIILPADLDKSNRILFNIILKMPAWDYAKKSTYKKKSCLILGWS